MFISDEAAARTKRTSRPVLLQRVYSMTQLNEAFSVLSVWFGSFFSMRFRYSHFGTHSHAVSVALGSVYSPFFLVSPSAWVFEIGKHWLPCVDKSLRQHIAHTSGNREFGPNWIETVVRAVSMHAEYARTTCVFIIVAFESNSRTSIFVNFDSDLVSNWKFVCFVQINQKKT